MDFCLPRARACFRPLAERHERVYTHFGRGVGLTPFFPDERTYVGGKLSGRSILIVDDDPDIVTALSAALSDSGAKLCIARDGEQAVETARKETPDLVILDAMLPRRSGLLVLEKLKPGKKRGQKPYVVMITANEGKRQQTWAESLGADGYLNKPFRMERLLGIVDKLLVDAEPPPPP